MTDQNTIPEDATIHSRIVPLRRPSDGLVARLALVRGAERTLDAQYYLWDSDAVGYLLLSRLIEAADRGVTVRLLVDDMKLRRRTRSIASLCLHPNIEIRVFNPWRRRSSAAAQGFEFIRRFSSLDQRMHNKLLVADNAQAIFGGRNVASAHYGLGERFNLVDYDLLLSGPDVSDLSHVFGTYWESPASVPGASLNESVSDGDLATTRALVGEELGKRTRMLSTILAEEAGWEQRMGSMSIPLSKDTVSVVADAPGVSQDAQPTQVIEALQRAVDSAKRELVVATPFLVPSESDVEWYQQIVERGVRVRFLTNSLASNMGTISNSGLNRQRLAIVNAGVELYELRTDAAVKPDWETAPQVARYLGLHAKFYTIDRERVFLGSVNLDPRSKYINTEIGVHIENTELAEETTDAIVRVMASDNAWSVEVGPDEHLRWRTDTEELHRQPARSPGQRLADTLLSHLPIRDYI